MISSEVLAVVNASVSVLLKRKLSLSLFIFHPNVLGR